MATKKRTTSSTKSTITKEKVKVKAEYFADNTDDEDTENTNNMILHIHFQINLSPNGSP